MLRRANRVLQTNIAMERTSWRPGHLPGRGLPSLVRDRPRASPAPAGNKYQFWFITERGMVRSVEIDADSSDRRS